MEGDMSTHDQSPIKPTQINKNFDLPLKIFVKVFCLYSFSFSFVFE